MGAGLLRTVRGMLVGAATLLSLAAPAQAQTLASLPTEPGIVPKAEARPIAAWVAFCESYAAECAVDRTELYIADEMFLCGTGVQISPVTSVDMRPVGDGQIGPVTKKIMEIYDRAVHGNHANFADWVTPVYKPLHHSLQGKAGVTA